jgi:Mrp family chromosome partitioning ATPase
MSNIYDALMRAEQQRRQQDTLDVSPPAALPPAKPPGLDLEDEMNALYAAINANLSDCPRKVILFMGTREGEGTSTVSRELARLTATRYDRTVLLVDADEAPDNSGARACPLGEILQHDRSVDDALRQVGSLPWYMSALSNGVHGGSEIFEPAHMKALLGTLRERFDYVLLDAPPAATSPVGLSLAGLADGVVLVVEAEKTRWPVAAGTKDQIVKHGGQLLGIALNKRKYHIPESVYQRLR